MPRKKVLSTNIYALNTDILLCEPLTVLSFKEIKVVPMTVLYELDNRQNFTGNEAFIEELSLWEAA